MRAPAAGIGVVFAPVGLAPGLEAVSVEVGQDGSGQLLGGFAAVVVIEGKLRPGLHGAGISMKDLNPTNLATSSAVVGYSGLKVRHLGPLRACIQVAGFFPLASVVVTR